MATVTTTHHPRPPAPPAIGEPVCVCGHGLSFHDTDIDTCTVARCECGDDLDGFEEADPQDGIDLTTIDLTDAEGPAPTA